MGFRSKRVRHSRNETGFALVHVLLAAAVITTLALATAKISSNAMMIQEVTDRRGEISDLGTAITNSQVHPKFCACNFGGGDATNPALEFNSTALGNLVLPVPNGIKAYEASCDPAKSRVMAVAPNRVFADTNTKSASVASVDFRNFMAIDATHYYADLVVQFTNAGSTMRPLILPKIVLIAQATATPNVVQVTGCQKLGTTAGLPANSWLIYDEPGTYTFTVPAFTTMKVRVWGGGGGGGCCHVARSGWPGHPGLSGQSSSFAALVAGGGAGGPGHFFAYTAAGGTASGGDVNTPGNSANGPRGGAGPNGGKASMIFDAAVSGNTLVGPVGEEGNRPGGGGGGGWAGANGSGGGGSGGFVEKVYASGQLAEGSTITVVVGAGAPQTGPWDGTYMKTSAGAHGRVMIKWQ